MGQQERHYRDDLGQKEGARINGSKIHHTTCNQGLHIDAFIVVVSHLQVGTYLGGWAAAWKRAALRHRSKVSAAKFC